MRLLYYPLMMMVLSAGLIYCNGSNAYSGSEISSAIYRINVTAGDFDRQGTVVSFDLPDYVPEGNYRMQNERGEYITLQVNPGSRAWFVLEDLPSGTSVSFTLHTGQGENSRYEPAAGRPEGGGEQQTGVVHRIDEQIISFSDERGEVLSYYHGYNDPPEELDERYRRGGYIHPVYSPEGVRLTNHLNVDQHPHHSGIWSAWTNTRFQERTPDFWNVHQNTGRVDIDTLTTFWSGPVHGGFESRHVFTDLSGGEPMAALFESWEVRVYKSSLDHIRIFDLKIIQSTASGESLILPESRYGGVGLRGHENWDDPEKAVWLTSEGLGSEGHGTRARWCHLGGEVDGKTAGLAVLGHPSNFRFPQTMRIHPSEPFFNFAPTQLGDMAIEPGKPLVTQYRFVTYDGEPDPDEIDRLWNDYAYPPGVTVSIQ